MQKVFSTLQTYLHSIKHSPWPPSLTSPGQAIGVCQSTFRMWFIIADITIRIMALWSSNNEGAGSALITRKDCRGRSLCDRSCQPSLYPSSVTWSKTTVSIHHQCETRSDVNTRFIGSSRTARANKLEDLKTELTAAVQYVSNVRNVCNCMECTDEPKHAIASNSRCLMP